MKFSARLFARFTGLSFIALTVASSIAQTERASTNYVLAVTPDHPQAIYQRGEKIAFNVKLLLDEKAVEDSEVQWTTSKDGVPPIQAGKLKLVDGRGTISAQLDEPGFVQCRVTFRAPEARALTSVAGAGIDPLDIKVSSLSTSTRTAFRMGSRTNFTALWPRAI